MLNNISVLDIHHGLSQANNRDNIGTPAFGHPDSRLMPAGRESALGLKPDLLQRTQETVYNALRYQTLKVPISNKLTSR